MRLASLCLLVTLVACGDDEAASIDARADDAALPADASPDGGGEGAICGGFPGTLCDEGYFCDWIDNSCGGDDGTGTCRPRPEICKPLEEPVCGCDGAVYATDCAAQQAGQDVSNAGGCEAPAKTDFACGHLFCDARTEYCERIASDVVGYPDDWRCRPLPDNCNGAASCPCLSDEPCGDQCEASGVGYRLTCPGG